MNKYIFLFVLSALFTLQVNAQKLNSDQVPMAVKNSFSSMFKSNTVANWELKNGNYEATFTSGGVETIGLFQPNGRFIQYEWNIKNADLPETAKTYMANKSVLGSKRIKNAAGVISYEVSTTDSKYLFDDKGNLASSK